MSIQSCLEQACANTQSSATQSASSATQSASSATQSASSASNADISAGQAQASATLASGYANFKGVWVSTTAYTVGQSVKGSNGRVYIALLGSTNQNPTNIGSTYWMDTTVTSSYGALEDTIFDLPLRNSLAMDTGVGFISYTRASTATYIDRYGVMKTAGINEPRINERGLLIETEATNTLLYSSDMSNSIWVDTSGVSTFNEPIPDPFGANGFAKFVPNSGLIAYVGKGGGVPTSYLAGTPYTLSVHIKAGDISKITVLASSNILFGGTGGSVSGAFDLIAKTSKSRAGVTTRLEELNDGNFRASISFTPTSSATYSEQIVRNTNASDADGVKGFYYCMPQLETDGHPTSYIPTTNTVATRAKDVCDATYDNNHPKIANGSPMSYSFEFDAYNYQSASYRFPLCPSSSYAPKHSMFRIETTGNVLKYYRVAGGQNIITSSDLKAKITTTISSSNVVKAFVNGVKVSEAIQTLFDATVSTTKAIGIGCQDNPTYGQLNGYIKNIKIWDFELSEAQVSQL